VSLRENESVMAAEHRFITWQATTTVIDTQLLFQLLQANEQKKAVTNAKIVADELTPSRARHKK